MKMFLIAVVCSLFLVLSAKELKSLPESTKETSIGRTFTHNVRRTKGKVFLKGFRPIAQKGPTCLRYSTVMILRYFHCNVIPREFKGERMIDDILYRYGFKSISLVLPLKNQTLFANSIKKAIDNGIPIQWGVNLRNSPSAFDRRAVIGKSNDGHARVITGYLHQDEVLTGIIYADSWGKSKNLNKEMNINSAYRMTHGLRLIYPKDLDKKTEDKLTSSPAEPNRHKSSNFSKREL